MAYGSPTRIEDVPEYLKRIYEGRPVPDYALKENTGKYSTAGGISPSNAIIDRLVAKLEAALSKDNDINVILGNKHWRPWLREAISSLHVGANDQVIAMPLFPFPSENVRNSYLEPLQKALQAAGVQPRISYINGIPTEALARIWKPILNNQMNGNDAVVFDAHSLPLFSGNESEYNAAFMEASRELAEQIGLQEYFAGYQSRGRYGNAWLEPTVYSVLDRVRSKGYRSIFAVPVGFLYEHLEILYDLDYQFGTKVKESGMNYHRSKLPDDSDSMIDEISRLVLAEVD